MEFSKTRRAALYARVSTADQHTDNQLIRLREVAERAGWRVVSEHVEVVSGAARDRPEFECMMRDARRRRVDLIAAVDVSRLGRTMKGLVDLFEELGELGCDLYLDREAVDTTTAFGKAMLRLASVFAALERDIISERTKAGMARARAQGKQIGRKPASDALVSSIRKLRSEGMGMDRIARQLRCGKGLAQRVSQQYDKEASTP